MPRSAQAPSRQTAPRRIAVAQRVDDAPRQLGICKAANDGVVYMEGVQVEHDFRIRQEASGVPAPPLSVRPQVDALDLCEVVLLSHGGNAFAPKLARAPHQSMVDCPAPPHLAAFCLFLRIGAHRLHLEPFRGAVGKALRAEVRAVRFHAKLARARLAAREHAVSAL